MLVQLVAVAAKTSREQVALVGGHYTAPGRHPIRPSKTERQTGKQLMAIIKMAAKDQQQCMHCQSERVSDTQKERHTHKALINLAIKWH